MAAFWQICEDDRETGDYEAVSFIDEDTAKHAVGEAESFCIAVEDYLRRNGYLAP
jgi:hypothetical protein